ASCGRSEDMANPGRSVGVLTVAPDRRMSTAPNSEERERTGSAALIQRDIMFVELADVDAARAEDAVILEVLEYPRGPPGEAAHGNMRGKELDRDVEAGIDDAGIEVDVGEDLLVLGEVRDHEAFEAARDVVLFLGVGIVPDEVLRQRREDAGAGIVGLVGAV